MSDDSVVDPRDQAGPDKYRDALLYDYAKYLTTLALIALGGVLSLTQAAGPGEIKPLKIALVLGSISLGGVLGVAAAKAIVEAEMEGKPRSRWAARYVKASMMLIGLGLGAFLAIWWDTLP